MTDYSSWTDEQVNEAIFKAKGWVWFESYGVWLNPVSKMVNEQCIYDYTHSWELCGELLEEMMPADVSLMYFKTLNKWGVDWVDNDGVEHQVVADTPQRAICEARLAWEEQG